MHDLDLKSGNNRVVVFTLSIKSLCSSVCFVSISISHNMCHMKFYFDSTKVICHELLFLMLIIYSEIQRFHILPFLCFADFVAMEVLSGRELWGYLVQPPY